MPLGTLQSFIQNMQAGQQQSRQAFEWKQKQDALAALGKMFGQSDAAAPDPQAATMQPTPQGGPGPVPQAGPPAQPVAVAPQTSAGMNPQAMAGLAALNGDIKANPQIPPQAAPGGAPQPGPPPMDPSISGTAQPQAAGATDAIQESQQNIKAMAASIKAANPGIDPRTLVLAVQDQIENIKGVAPLTKATMTAQIQTLRIQQDFQYKQQRLNQFHEKLLIDWKNAKTKEQQAQAMKEYHDSVIALGEDRIAASESIAAGHDSTRIAAANIGATSRQAVADTNQQGANYRADERADVGEYTADQGFRGRQVVGGSADPAPQRPSARRGGAPRPAVPSGAKQAPDGHWYVPLGGGKFRRVG